MFALWPIIITPASSLRRNTDYVHRRTDVRHTTERLGEEMPIGSFADNGKVETETIVLSRALLEIEEITLNYGDDPDTPAPYEVKNKDGETLFTADPNINALVKIVDDYGEGDYDNKKFFDKFYLKQNKKSEVWEAGEKSKLGMLLKAHPKYGVKHFQDPKPVDEKDFEGMRFEAATEQKENRSGKKLEGTRIAWKTIGQVPNRSKKKKKIQEEGNEETDKEVERQLSKAEEAEMDKVFAKVK